jgi:hypothetical protein
MGVSLSQLAMYAPKQALLFHLLICLDFIISYGIRLQPSNPHRPSHVDTITAVSQLIFRPMVIHDSKGQNNGLIISIDNHGLDFFKLIILRKGIKALA